MAIQMPTLPLLRPSMTWPRQDDGPHREWLEAFSRGMLAEHRFSVSTMEAYALDVATVARWAEARGKDLLNLSPADFSEYLAERLQAGSRPSTLARHVTSCRRFYAFLMAQGLRSTNPAAAVERPQEDKPRVPHRIPVTALPLLLRPRRDDSLSPSASYFAQRDYTIVRLLYGCDLSVTDVRLLRWQQLGDPGHLVRGVFSHRKVRGVMLDPSLLAALGDLYGRKPYGGHRQADSAFCFPTPSGMPLTRQGLCHVVRKWARECGLQDAVTPSALRQTGLSARSARFTVTQPQRRYRVPTLGAGADSGDQGSPAAS